MSTSPQRGQVVRIVVMSSQVSTVARRGLSAASPASSSVPLQRPPGELPDPFAEALGGHHVAFRTEPQEQALDPLESTRGQLDLEPAVVELGLADRLVVL